MNTRKTVLIADDTAINRQLLQDIFAEHYETILAKDGQEAIDILARHANEISLAVIDIRMPVKNGFDVLTYMAESHMNEFIPAIIITSSDDFQDELHAYNLGASDIIHKPFVPQVVLRRCENAMELLEHRNEMVQRLEHVETYDALTGLYNMQAFLHKADTRLYEAGENYGEYYFVYNNIRNFKMYNLNYGQEAGNRVLLSLTEKVKQLFPNDLHSRLGSDHMASLIHSKDMLAKHQEVLDFFDQEFGKTGMKLKIGLYRVDQKGQRASTASDFAKIACDAIYATNDSVSVYTDTLSKRMNTSTYVLSHFEEALENHYIQVYYQPVVRTITNKLCGMEALARWIDPRRGFLSPIDFITVLENNHLISKLDLYMLRIICKDMRDAARKRLELIPVSFNLSRFDFVDCDIFHEVEKILKEYEIPRDMINLEITESTIMENPGYMKEIIDRFRNVGYQVWMDDFGSGFSSLNVLKDYQFDEIKLDMKFLSSFDEKSKKIIESMIQMAKNIGVQTLAEGVETQEQLDYLQSIGCEKAQGYLFSQPRAISDLYELCEEKHVSVENRAWRAYYNRIGKVDFITDRALSIVEYNGEEFKYLFVNPTYQEVWESLGVTDMHMVYENINSPTTVMSHQFRDLQRSLHEGETREIVYSVRNQYVRLNATCLSQHEDYSTFAVEITNLNHEEVSKKKAEMDDVFRMMYALFDSVYLIDVDHGTFKTMMQSPTSNLESSKNFHDRHEINPSAVAEIFIYPDEREEYIAFTDPTTLLQRLRSADHGYITQYYRTKTGNGSYVWKAHTLLRVPETNQIIYCSKFVQFGQTGLMDRLIPEYARKQVFAQESNDALVFRGLMESHTLNLFWKDSHRRFLGANTKFLDTYGFSDESMIIGKTDEEMGWHVDTEPFENDEWRVLKKGEVLQNRLGKCIIKGVEHNILASKEPLYQDGKIVGLIGGSLIWTK